MSTFDAIVLAVIQGITEWLPVSSSGHLALYHHLRALEEPFLYSVLLHFSSFFVIIVFFRKKIMGLARSFRGPAGKGAAKSYLANIGIGSLPAAAAGFLLRHRIAEVFGEISIIAAAWIFTGIILAVSVLGREKAAGITMLTAFAVGCAQAAALVPGISRSGMTISTALLCGAGREESAEFSFLLALPALFGAGILELPAVVNSLPAAGAAAGADVHAGGHAVLFLLGAAVSFAAGLAALNVLMKVIRRGKFPVFAVYCLAIGAVVLLVGV